MASTRYTWNDDKAAANKRKHGVDFTTATLVFTDPNRYEEMDSSHSHSEERWRTVGMGGTRTLCVVFTERHGNEIRIITARKATRNERRKYHYLHF